jgi:hypothetical protein
MNDKETETTAKQISRTVENSIEEVLKSLPKVNAKAVIFATSHITLSLLMTIYDNWKFDARNIVNKTIDHEFDKFINHEEDRFDD